MGKKSIQIACTALLFIGVFGSIACRHYGINNTMGIFTLRSAMMVGLLGGQFFRYLESKGNKGKRIINLILLVALTILVVFAFGELIGDLRE